MKEFFRRTPKHFTPAERDNGQQIPDNMWAKCPSCGELIYTKQLNDNLIAIRRSTHQGRGSSLIFRVRIGSSFE